MPGREDFIDRNSRTNDLNSESYAGEVTIIIAIRLLRKRFLSLINMDKDKKPLQRKKLIQAVMLLPSSVQAQAQAPAWG